MKYLLIGFLKLYRLLISPLYGNVCRFYPSCSAYALESVQVHGAVGGSWLTVRRLVRCHPWNPGGYDPVPTDWRHPEAEQATDVAEAAVESRSRLAADPKDVPDCEYRPASGRRPVRSVMPPVTSVPPSARPSPKATLRQGTP